jgi:glycosyltransferase involved in cell wall biosynthesis
MISCDVTVVIPAYNAANFLELAVDSIQAQHWPNLEIIVVDDASKDETAKIAASLPVTLVQHKKNEGAAAARNTGVSLATTSLIAFLDADDEWLPGKLEMQIDILRRNPDLDGVLGFIETCNRTSGSEQQAFLPSFGTALLRRELFVQVGLCDQSLRMCDDLDWFTRAREQGANLAVLGKSILRYRRHEDNMTNNTLHVNYWLARALQAHVLRLRQRPVEFSDVPVLIEPIEVI